MIRPSAICLAKLLVLTAVTPVVAFEPVLPDGAQVVASEAREQRIYALPTGAFEDGAVPADSVTGEVRRRSWRIASGFEGTTGLSSALASQLLNEDFDILFSCDGGTCGGFDFRFNTEVLLPPHMFVDLADFVFLSALKSGDAGLEAVSVLISRTAEAGMVQVIDVMPSEAAVRRRPMLRPGSGEAAKPSTGDRPEQGGAAQSLTDLERLGFVTLTDLEFETGSATLGAGPFELLEALATFLNGDTSRRVALVGHTDSVGGLEGNTELSRRRAAAVMQRLIETHKVTAAQLEARGVGYLAPVASNLSEAGRAANRRVEAVLLNTK
ncbi:MAG: OmpA family protein [Shimia sp.]|jgi:OOP family OmpA-OmpF porin|uniref:OmpA family protein n=1 Tax=Shimia sp. TaxID=1954381 RepID=UPI004059AB83